MCFYEMMEIGYCGLDVCLMEVFMIVIDECDGVFLFVDIDVCDLGYVFGIGILEFGGFIVC